MINIYLAIRYAILLPTSVLGSYLVFAEILRPILGDELVGNTLTNYDFVVGIFLILIFLLVLKTTSR